MYDYEDVATLLKEVRKIPSITINAQITNHRTTM